MDALMLGVTGVALALAVGMSIIAVRLLRGERHRSAARVAALETAALDEIDEIDEIDQIDAFEYREPPRARVRATASHARHAAPAFADTLRLNQDFDDDLKIEHGAPAGPMFGATNEPKAPSRRWLALAGVAVVMAALIGTIYVVFKPATVDASGAGASIASNIPAAPTGPASGTGVVSQAAQLRPIELLSLKHTIDASTFSLVGLVVNPIDAAPLTQVVAVVYLFDKDGAYFASGKAELEFSGLRPGEESPFAITIPNVSRVGKYRVGFRREDGSVIAHVDRRGKSAGSMTEGGGDQ